MSSRARKLNQSPWAGVFHLAGGGTSLIAELLATPGASATVLDVRIPYAFPALEALLGYTPEQACSDATARAMAMRAFQEALALGAESPFGFAVTASLATDRIKRGSHRAHAAIQTRSRTITAHWELAGSREAEEALLAERLWAKLGAALGVEGVGPAIELKHTEGKPAWQALILGEAQALATEPHDGRLLFPGAFNPLHPGHREMLALAEAISGLAGAYELSVANVDKPFLDYRDIETRLAAFDRPVWLTRLPTFVEKARQFPNALFVVGLDTLVRIAAPRYYGNRATRDEALTEIAEYGVRFLVFGRELDGTFRTLSDPGVDLPAALEALCQEVPESRFRSSESSTRIRDGRKPSA
jgi:nicotinamide mononucleotide (NMN) deamidase PncC